MEADPGLAPGYELDRYQLLCSLAQGGMASVWLARLRGKRGFERLFAIKTIRTEFILEPGYEEMFLDEARIASGIHHPNVAHIVDLGEQDNVLYLVMEWVDGESLAKIAELANAAKLVLPMHLVLRAMADTCAGLHAAHELVDQTGANLGVVHRDVSPHNIILTATGASKLIDFGIAKGRHREAGETQEGVIKGKIRYMSPEQVAGRAVDRRTDIWALGMCLHELLTGREPFGDLEDLDVLRHLMGDRPEPELDDEGYPPPVRAILARSLVRDPARRFETAAEMRRAIERAIESLGTPATSEDLAEYVASHFPELAQRRYQAVQRAITVADARESGGDQGLEPTGEGEKMVFAGTLAFPSSPPPPVRHSSTPAPPVRRASTPPPARRVSTPPPPVRHSSTPAPPVHRPSTPSQRVRHASSRPPPTQRLSTPPAPAIDPKPALPKSPVASRTRRIEPPTKGERHEVSTTTGGAAPAGEHGARRVCGGDRHAPVGSGRLDRPRSRARRRHSGVAQCTGADRSGAPSSACFDPAYDGARSGGVGRAPQTGAHGPATWAFGGGPAASRCGAHASGERRRRCRREGDGGRQCPREDDRPARVCAGGRRSLRPSCARTRSHRGAGARGSRVRNRPDRTQALRRIVCRAPPR
jgi:serine/threonine-protein kinase